MNVYLVSSSEFQQDYWQQTNMVPRLSCSVSRPNRTLACNGCKIDWL